MTRPTSAVADFASGSLDAMKKYVILVRVVVLLSQENGTSHTNGPPTFHCEVIQNVNMSHGPAKDDADQQTRTEQPPPGCGDGLTE